MDCIHPVATNFVHGCDGGLSRQMLFESDVGRKGRRFLHFTGRACQCYEDRFSHLVGANTVNLLQFLFQTEIGIQ